MRRSATTSMTSTTTLPFQAFTALFRLPATIVMLAVLTMTLSVSTPASASKYAAIVIEENSGRVLFARNADKSRFPASLTKIMTLYLLFEELQAGRISMNTRFPVSRVAASRSPSKLYLKPGQSITAKDAIYALITKSANDVATVVAEKLSGTEREFGKRMTRKARALGMSRTTFRNASGLPHSKQQTTARDMAKLAVAMRRDFPSISASSRPNPFATRATVWQPQQILSQYEGTDGIKTGYIDASGFNLVATVQRRGVRLIGVVFGGRTGNSRNAHMMKILDKSFKRVKLPISRPGGLRHCPS